MTEKIDKYFTPSRSAKRHRTYSSPETAVDNLAVMGNDGEKVGDLTYGHLMCSLETMLSGLLDKKLSLLATKDDFADLTGKINKLAQENETLKQEISRLKSQEKITRDRVIDLESRSRRNNLIFKGLKYSENTRDYKSVVGRFLDEVLGAGGQLYVNRAHRLGGGNAVIAHIPHDGDIDYIMSKTKLLKGTGYVVHRDYPAEIRQKRSCLMAVRAEVEKVAGNTRMPLYFDHLIINKHRFTWEDGRLMVGAQDGGEMLRTLFGCDFGQFLATLGQTQGEQHQRRGPGMSKPATAHGGPTGRQEATLHIPVTPAAGTTTETTATGATATVAATTGVPDAPRSSTMTSSQPEV